jgi:L-histidine Nalpha-methyltransferase
MHLVSLNAQEIDVAGAGLHFRLEEGETIWTESSYKFTPERVRQFVQTVGFIQRHQWIDKAARFALTLFEAA